MIQNGDPVDSDEQVSRFAFEKSYFSRQDNTVKPKAFEPQNCIQQGYTALETSVFRMGGLTASEAWAVADKEVVPLRKKPVVARAIIGVAKVRETGLDVSHAVPPERHAVIVNWPTDDLEILFKTQELAAAAVLERRD